MVGASIWFFQTIATPQWSFSWFLTINPWISSFIITYTTFALLDACLGKLAFFKKHKYLFLAISFFVSTFLGESLTYELLESIPWHTWLFASLEYLAGFAVLLIATLEGIWLGVQKGNKELEESIKQYNNQLKEMPKEHKKALIKSCKKALRLDDGTFFIISHCKTREDVEEILNDALAGHHTGKL